MKKKKKNIFVRFFCCIGRGIRNFFLFFVFLILYLIALPVALCKVVGKNKLKDDDEARVFVCNHYEIFGPVSIYLSFPLKTRPWIIDKMMDSEKVEKQMSLLVMNENNFKWAPKWFRKLTIHCLKNLVVFIMKFAGGISVSHDNLRSNVTTLSKSTKVLENHESIVIYPELSYVKEGVGEFQSGFEHIGKYYYQKTGKKISFYPVFISKLGKRIFIGDRIVFNPDNEKNKEKANIVNFLHDNMEQLYIDNELNNAKIQKKKAKKEIKMQKKQEKGDRRQEKKKNKQNKKGTSN